MPSLLPPAPGPTACLSFPVWQAGAEPRSPGERRCSCQRLQPGNPWTRNKGTLEPPAAGSPRRPLLREGRCSPQSTGTPPNWDPSLLREAKPLSSGTRHCAGHPRGGWPGCHRCWVTWMPPAGPRQGGGPVLRCQAKSLGRDERIPPHLSALRTCRRCRVIQASIYLPCPGGRGLTWACSDP